AFDGRHRVGGGADGGDVDALAADQVGELRPLGVGRLHQQHALLARLVELLQPGERLVQGVAGPQGLGQHAHRAHAQAALSLLLGGDEVNGDVAGGQVVLEAVQHAPAVDVGEVDVQGDGV